jgi:hypothetical protein
MRIVAGSVDGGRVDDGAAAEDRGPEVEVAGFVLVQTHPTKDLAELAREVVLLPGVTRAEAVRGPYDVIVEVCEHDPGRLTWVTATAIRALDGVLHAIPLPVRLRRAHAHDAARAAGADGADAC